MCRFSVHHLIISITSCEVKSAFIISAIFKDREERVASRNKHDVEQNVVYDQAAGVRNIVGETREQCGTVYRTIAYDRRLQATGYTSIVPTVQDGKQTGGETSRRGQTKHIEE